MKNAMENFVKTMSNPKVAIGLALVGGVGTLAVGAVGLINGISTVASAVNAGVKLKQAGDANIIDGTATESSDVVMPDPVDVENA